MLRSQSATWAKKGSHGSIGWLLHNPGSDDILLDHGILPSLSIPTLLFDKETRLVVTGSTYLCKISHVVMPMSIWTERMFIRMKCSNIQVAVSINNQADARQVRPTKIFSNHMTLQGRNSFKEIACSIFAFVSIHGNARVINTR